MNKNAYEKNLYKQFFAPSMVRIYTLETLSSNFSGIPVYRKNPKVLIFYNL